MSVISQVHAERFSLYHGDCVEALAAMPDASVDFSVYSPPFAGLYIYSESERDMGNCANDAEFIEHYEFLIREKLRLTKPGRISCVHCAPLPSHKWKDGECGWKDFRGDIIRAHQRNGWVYHSEVVIWKDPVVEVTRTKALRLLYKQLTKDSSKSGIGMPDYVVIFRKPGEAESPITHDRAAFPVEQWQKWASPVWMDVRQTRVLNGEDGRENGDEKHICPLQLDVIERCIRLWSNEGDTVLSPFMGIGSEGYVALREGRRFIGVELKLGYFNLAHDNIRSAAETRDADLFRGVHV